MQRAILYMLVLLGLLTTAVRAELISGPMIAHLEMREAKSWIQTDEPTLVRVAYACLLYTSDAADEGLGVDLGGRRII